jgi:sensor histidine kinase YesM
MNSIKKIIYLLAAFLLIISCSTNYYTVLLTEDAKIYTSTDSSNVVTIVPKDTQVFISPKANKKNYKKIKWGNYSGWAYNPAYTTYSNYTSYNSSYYRSSSTSSSPSSSGTVHVRGYTRKDGTYVRPHTRSSPSTRRR